MRPRCRCPAITHLAPWVAVLGAGAGGCGPEGRLPGPVTDVEPIAQIDAGNDHTCAVLRNGNLACWGSNAWGQGGLRPRSDGTLPRTVGTPTWVELRRDPRSVAAGASHSCALFADGTVECWGAPTERDQLREGALCGAGIPVQAGGESCPAPPTAVADLADATQIAAGGFLEGSSLLRAHPVTCAVRANGSATCWGARAAAAGDPPIEHTPLLDGNGFPVREIRQLAVGGLLLVAADAGGQVWSAPLVAARGAVSADKVVGLAGAIAVAAGGGHACAATTTGEVFCWGSNINGQAGPTTGPCRAERETCRRDVPGPVPGVAGARAVAAGERHSCALVEGGDVWCWGSNQKFQVGVDGGALEEPARRVALPVAAQAITCGRSHTCALAADGTAYCWGELGQLGG